jgi:hypothetical protein
MSFEFDELVSKMKYNPSWKLMAADHAPLIISFLDRVFRERNLRQVDEQELIMYLQDYLYELNEGSEVVQFPRSAQEYLQQWTEPDKDWLRKFYPQGSDIPHYDLTSDTERVLGWIDTLFFNQFIGTESRLNTCFDLLKQIVQGAEKDKDTRIAELQEQKKQIDQEIAQLEAGELKIMDQRQIRERFLQFKRTAKELLGDFRAVEHHFRELDSEIRREIATYSGEKGELLQQFFGEHDAITNSDEGQSFQAFWDFIMGPNSQQELSNQLDKVFQLEELGDLSDDFRLRRIHFDWIEAGAQTQRTFARLSKQLRRYLDDRSFLENRRISELIESLEKKAILVKDSPPVGMWMEVPDYQTKLSLLMEMPLFSPAQQKELNSSIPEPTKEAVDTDRLFDCIYVDRQRLQRNIDEALTEETQVSLGLLLKKRPLQMGLSELITYLQMAEEDPFSLIDDQGQDSVSWIDETGLRKEATFPKTIFCHRGSHGTE